MSFAQPPDCSHPNETVKSETLTNQNTHGEPIGEKQNVIKSCPDCGHTSEG